MGLRLTSVEARMRMARWLRTVKHHLKKVGMKIWLCVYYVDDVRLVVSPLPLGWRWTAQPHGWTVGKVSYPRGGSFQFKEEWGEEDRGLSETERTSKQLLTLMNDVEPDLKFTMELKNDFPDGKLPTLDFTLRLSRRDAIPDGAPKLVMYYKF